MANGQTETLTIHQSMTIPIKWSFFWLPTTHHNLPLKYLYIRSSITPIMSLLINPQTLISTFWWKPFIKLTNFNVRKTRILYISHKHTHTSTRLWRRQPQTRPNLEKYHFDPTSLIPLLVPFITTILASNLLTIQSWIKTMFNHTTNENYV
jgi:hypothetical protein